MVKLEGFAREVFLDKYAAAGETEWEHCARRVARHVSQAENGQQIEWENEFYNAIEQMSFIPGGRILFGAGRPRQSLLNCFALYPQDNVESLGQLLKNVYLISCQGGGVGFNFSAIRPRGDSIQNIKFSAPGTVSEMRKIDVIGKEVRGGKNRRAALLAILNVDHPDILHFLHAKLDLKQLNNFNVSVGITNDFIKAVEKNKDWSFKFNNRDYFVYTVERVYRNGRTETIELTAFDEEDAIGRAYASHKKNATDKFRNAKIRQYKAKELWNTIIDNARICGEPGLFNIDLINNFTNVSYFMRMDQSNPCVSGDTLVFTTKGPKPIEELSNSGEGFDLFAGNGNVTNGIAFSTGKKKVYKVDFTDGRSLICTLDHKLLTPDGKVKLENLDIGDHVMAGRLPSYTNEKGAMELSRYSKAAIRGWLAGDGCLSDNASILMFYHNDLHLVDSMNRHCENVLGKQLSISEDKERQRKTIQSTALTRVLNLVGKDKYYIPREYFSEPILARQYLSWLFSADGSVQGKLNGHGVSVRLSSSKPSHLRDVQNLLQYLGINSRIYKRRPDGVRMLPDGHGGNKAYQCNADYELIVSRDNVTKFYEQIKIKHKDKQKKLYDIEQARQKSPYKDRMQTAIADITPLDEREVYDIRVKDESHSYIANGIQISNCGEVPLENGGNCCLGSINLDNMYNEKKNDVDWKKLAKTIRVAVRFLDNVITINNYPIPLTKEIGNNSRRIGIGVMGLHYLLIKLGYRYGSEESLEFLERLFSTMRNEAYLASIEVAKEKGSFQSFDPEKFLKEEYAKTLPQRIRRRIKKYGIRNALLMTIPPTGTTSIVVSVSSGVEPIFAPVYKRSYRDPEDPSVWKHAIVIDKIFQEYYTSGKDTSHIVGAYDITPEEHLSVQATIQKFICSSISKTINCPKDIKSEHLSDVIFEFMSDLKGVTIYREGSREEEPLTMIDISNKKELEKIMEEARVGSNSIDSCKDGSCEI